MNSSHTSRIRFRCPLATLACGVCTLLTACFSMSPVRPAPGLAPIEHPDHHDAATFDPGSSAEVESDWGKDGTFVLLHPTVNGHDVGWFIFDTGASGCTITANAAAAAGLTAIGTTRLQRQAESTVYRCDAFAVGPLTLTGLNMTGLNMSRSPQAFGRPIAGFVGRNVCSSAVIELDGPGRVVRLRDPNGAWIAGSGPETTSDETHPIAMRQQLPHVECSYPDSHGDRVEGSFVLDTGANATIHFLSRAVERHGLLQSEGVTITGSRTQITFGSTGRIKEGTIEGFHVGDQALGPLAATFAVPGDKPTERLPETDGLIGMGLMRTFVVILDEPHGHVSFAGPEDAPHG